MPNGMEWGLPHPDRVYHAIDSAQIEMVVHPHDDLEFSLRRVPGGSFSAELDLRATYAGHELSQVLNLDREAAAALRDALDNALDEAGDE